MISFVWCLPTHIVCAFDWETQHLPSKRLLSLPKSATPTLDTSSHFTAATEIVRKHKPGQVTPLPWTSPLPSGESPSSLGLQDRPMGFLEVDSLLMEIQPNEWPLFSTEVGWGRGRQVRVKAGLEHWPVPASGNRLATRQSSGFINRMFSGWGAPRKGLRVQWWEGLDWVYVLKVEPARLVHGMDGCEKES